MQTTPRFRHMCINANTAVVRPKGRIVMIHYFDTRLPLIGDILANGFSVLIESPGMQDLETLEFPGSHCSSTRRPVRPKFRCTGTRGEKAVLQQQFPEITSYQLKIKALRRSTAPPLQPAPFFLTFLIGGQDVAEVVERSSCRFLDALAADCYGPRSTHSPQQPGGLAISRRALLTPLPSAELEPYPVSTFVNVPRNDSSECGRSTRSFWSGGPDDWRRVRFELPRNDAVRCG